MTEGPKIKMVAKKHAAKTTTRRVFALDQCHHRGADGQPDCRKKKWTKNVNLCEAHEKVWQKAARERAKAAEAPKPKAPAKPAKPASDRRAARPARQPIKRVPTAEPQLAVVQLVPPK